ncbi:MAG: flavoprotein [Polyangiaceae bacterium]|nr:flavoprotein [Polyangiaceae bacterium]
MTTELRLLRDSLELALSVDDRFPARFYELLFERHPELEVLFVRNSRGAQVRSFGKKLVAIVDHLDDPEWTQRTLESLAAGHVGYGVTAPMYDHVGDALIDTLREGCGDAFSPEVERAWREAYARISAAMLAASST